MSSKKSALCCGAPFGDVQVDQVLRRGGSCGGGVGVLVDGVDRGSDQRNTFCSGNILANIVLAMSVCDLIEHR